MKPAKTPAAKAHSKADATTVATNGTVTFELKGESLAAAKRLGAEIEKELQTVKPLQTGRMDHIQQSWNDFYDGLTRRLEKEAPEVLQATGLTSPATQVFQGKQTLPRAYLEYPAIFLSPEKEPRYFMYSPVDYKGDFFTPQDAKLLGDKKNAVVGELLFAGGWLGNAPLVSRKKSGVSTPADYNPATNDALKKSYNYAANRGQRCFIAGGESLAAVQDNRRRETEWRAAVDTVTNFIKALVEKQFPEMEKTIPAGEGLRASCSYSYGGYLDGATEIHLAVRMDGKANIWNAGKTVPLLENPAFATESREGGEATIVARTDTPEGRNLKMLMDMIPRTPALGEYEVLHGNFNFRQNKIESALGINGVVPQAVDLGGKTILIYNTASKAKSSFCPKGATPLPTEAYQWLQSDKGDINMGITPPPMPPEVTALFEKADLKPQQPRRRAPKP
ncbi:MAG: hypothetical protein PW788_04365 [Micavibrio sp.]|nr:hypothetical protein [Micavibrio sp.]